VRRAIAVPLISPSRQPRLPQPHGPPPGTTTTWPTCPALPCAPSSSRPSTTSPPPTPVETTMARKLEHPAAAPFQPSPSASALASPSTTTGRSSSARRRASSGKPRQPGMFSGDTVSPWRVIGPAEPTPHAATPSGATSRTAPTSAAKTSSGSVPRGVGATAERSTVPCWSTTPAAILVPPMSTARTVGLKSASTRASP
jgi:hypothetical protein